MDLIEIYQKGKWGEFVSEYDIYKQEIDELFTLLDEFTGDYFLEYNVNLLSCKKALNVIKNKFKEVKGDSYKENSLIDDWFFEIVNSKGQEFVKFFLGENYKSPTNVMSDPRIARLEYLANKWNRTNCAAKRRVKLIYLEAPVPLDQERLEFVNKYFTKNPLRVEFDNSLEEAIDYGYSEVIEFIKTKTKLTSKFFYSKNLYKYLGKKLKRIRCNAKLSEEDLFEKLNLSVDCDMESESMNSKSIKKCVKAIEDYGDFIDLEMLIKYVNYFNIKLDDIIGHNSVMKELVRRQKLIDEEFIRGE